MELYYKKQTHTTRIKKNDDVSYVTYDALDNIPWLYNAFSTRLGGVSTGKWSSMNLNFNVGDTKENVLENFSRFGDVIGVLCEQMIFSKQTHTTNVLKVDSSMAGMGIVRERNFDDIDGLITNEPGICLVTSYADCVPLYFVDRKNQAIGLSHSGWRGTVDNIAKNTFEQMNKEFGTDAEDLIVCIGPSICEDCYEISEDVAVRFKECYTVKEQEAILKTKVGGKYQLNLQNACRFNLLRLGIRDENIIMPDLCTCCNPKLLFSHRASKGERGGLCAFLGIKAE